MIQLHRMLLLYCLNAFWQVPMLYMASFVSNRLLRDASAVARYRLWMGGFLLCVGLPLVSATGWIQARLEHAFVHTWQVSRSVSETIVAEADLVQSARTAEHSVFGSLTAGNLLLAVWATFVVFRTFEIVWTSYRIVRIVNRAVPSGSRVSLKGRLARGKGRGVEVLVSDEISVPAAAGVWRPVVLLPQAMEDSALPCDLDAVVAHEWAHVTRHDFACNLLLEVLAIPIAYNPATRRLLGNISEVRELICDRMAAEQTGSAHGYAESLLRISEALIQPITSTDPAPALFDGQSLEKRIMSLLNPTTSLPPRRRTAAMGLLSLLIFAPCCLAAVSISYQPAVLVATDLQPYAGSWQWMFQGKPFVTMELVAAGDHFTGYMTNGFFSYDDAGNMIDAGSHPGRSAIVRTFFSGKTLHIVVQYDQDKSLSEWTMNLVDAKTASFNTVDQDAPKNFKPWTAKRISN